MRAEAGKPAQTVQDEGSHQEAGPLHRPGGPEASLLLSGAPLSPNEELDQDSCVFEFSWTNKIPKTPN